MSEGNVNPNSLSVSRLIDWVRDDCDPATQKHIALRHALRFIPAVFTCADETIWLQSCQFTLIAFVHHWDKDSAQGLDWNAAGRSGIQPPSAANALITVKEGANAIFYGPSQFQQGSTTERLVELCLADGFDTLRDLVAEMPNGRVGHSKRKELEIEREMLRRSICQDLTDLANFGADHLYAQTLWRPQALRPSAIDWSIDNFDSATPSTSIWAFWRDWYQGFLNGKPLDWELQRRVALIPDEDWEKGPEHIAALIEEIQAEFNTRNAGENARHPDLEPDNVVPLFKNKHIVSASNLRLEADIKQAIGQFHEETGLNEFPEMFEPLRALPASLGKISAIVLVSQPTADTEQVLREEIGRLNAKIVALEAELSKAAKDGLISEFKKQVGRSLGDWKLYAAIAGAVWLVSGDQVGMKQRLENIQELRNDLFGSESPFPKLDQHFSNQKE